VIDFVLGAVFAYASVFVTLYVRVQLALRSAKPIVDLDDARAAVPSFRVVHLFRKEQ